MQFTATGIEKAPVTVTPLTATWSISSSAIASIGTSDGFAQCASTGTVAITASARGTQGASTMVSGTATLTCPSLLLVGMSATNEAVMRMTWRRRCFAAAILFSLLAVVAGCGSLFDSCHHCPPPINSAEFVFAANLATSASNVSAFKVDPTTGVLTAASGSPFGGVTSPEWVTATPAAKFAYVTNFSDNTISAYAIDATSGALTTIAGSPFPAAGNPVMIASERSGKYLYTANQGSNDVSGFVIDAATGAISPISGSPFASGLAPVAVDPAGKFVFLANSSSSTISAFSIDSSGGRLTPVPGSPFPTDFFPRAFAIDPSSKFLFVGISSSFVGDSTEVMAFTIGSSGALIAVPGSPFTAGRNPIAPTVDSSGRFLYVGNNMDSTLSAFTINPTSGVLTAMSGSPFTLSGSVLFCSVDVSGKFLYVAGAGISGFPAGINVVSMVTAKTK
jgi:6-phosphogluconolactonase